MFTYVAWTNERFAVLQTPKSERKKKCRNQSKQIMKIKSKHKHHHNVEKYFFFAHFFFSLKEIFHSDDFIYLVSFRSSFLIFLHYFRYFFFCFFLQRMLLLCDAALQSDFYIGSLFFLFFCFFSFSVIFFNNFKSFFDLFCCCCLFLCKEKAFRQKENLFKIVRLCYSSPQKAACNHTINKKKIAQKFMHHSSARWRIHFGVKEQKTKNNFTKSSEYDFVFNFFFCFFREWSMEWGLWNSKNSKTRKKNRNRHS